MLIISEIMKTPLAPKLIPSGNVLGFKDNMHTLDNMLTLYSAPNTVSPSFNNGKVIQIVYSECSPGFLIYKLEKYFDYCVDVEECYYILIQWVCEGESVLTSKTPLIIIYEYMFVCASNVFFMFIFTFIICLMLNIDSQQMKQEWMSSRLFDYNHIFFIYFQGNNESNQDMTLECSLLWVVH